VGDDNAVQVVTYLGDTENAALVHTGRNNPYGVNAALDMILVGLTLQSGFADAPMVDPVIVAGIQGTGEVPGVQDALYSIDAGLTLVTPQLPAIPTGFTITQVVGPDPQLLIPAVSAAAGATVLVPVNLDDSDGVNQVNLVLSYDTSRLQLLGVQAGSLTQPAQGFTISSDVDPQAGVLVVNASSARALSDAGAGSVAVLEFQVNAAAPAGASFVNLDASVPTDTALVLGAQSTQLSGVDGQGDPAIFVLSPAPTNAPGSPDDGLVNVQVAATPGAAPALQTPAVTSVQATSSSAALPGAAFVNVLFSQSVTDKATFVPSPPWSNTIMVGVPVFSGQPGQTAGLSPAPFWQVQALVPPSTPDPWQSLGGNFDPGSLPWWDTPGSS